MDINRKTFIDNLRGITADPKSAYTGAEIATVISASPLTLNCNGVEVTEDFIYLTPLCKAFTTTALKHSHTHSHTCPEGSTSSDATEALQNVIVWRGLQAGDNVLVIRTNRSQKYVVICRLSNL